MRNRLIFKFLFENNPFIVALKVSINVKPDVTSLEATLLISHEAIVLYEQTVLCTVQTTLTVIFMLRKGFIVLECL